VKIERIPNGRYPIEFREETVKMAMDGDLSVLAISRRHSLPKSIFGCRIRVSNAGNHGEIGIRKPCFARN
jgi:transposase-like protein